MLILVAIALIVIWALSFVVLHVTSALIHLLLIAAVAVALVRLFRGSDTPRDISS